MAEEIPESARATDQPAPTQAAADPAASPGSDATFPHAYEGPLVPFRESLYAVLSLDAYKYRGSYTQDLDWTMEQLRRKLRRNPTLFEMVTVQIVLGAAQGSIKHIHELLDRLEGTVAQRIEFDVRRRAAEYAEKLGVTVEEVLAEAAQIAGRVN